MKEKIVKLINEGDLLFKEESYLDAIDKYKEANNYINDDTFDLYFADIQISIGDSYFKLKDCDNALNHFFEALKDSDVENSSFVMLRLGQCIGTNGDIDKAKFYFLKAYQIDGEDAFYGHEELLPLIDDVLSEDK
ncbi:MAG: tetratricopeptide repeat protein [Bacilli bacterium]